MANVLFRNDNINTGHCTIESANRSLAVQTPPVNFIVQNKSVSNLTKIVEYSL